MFKKGPCLAVVSVPRVVKHFRLPASPVNTLGIGFQLSKYWNIYWRLIPSLSIGRISGIFLHFLISSWSFAWTPVCTNGNRLDRTAKPYHAVIGYPLTLPVFVACTVCLLSVVPVHTARCVHGEYDDG